MKLGSMAMFRAAVVSFAVILTAWTAVACSTDQPTTAPTPTQIVMPNLTGEYWTDAATQLRSIGWTGTIAKGPDIPKSPAERNRILFQDPRPGDQMERNREIVLRFGI